MSDSRRPDGHDVDLEDLPEQIIDLRDDPTRTRPAPFDAALYEDPVFDEATHADALHVDDTSFEDYVSDPRVIETRAMDLAELALEVTARPHADPDDVVPQRSAIDIALDPPRYADDPVPEPAPDADTGGGDTPPVVIDERLERRRDEVVSDNRRRRRRRFAGALGVLAVAGAGVGLVYSPLLAVEDVSVVGSDRLSVADLAKATGVRVGSPIVFVDPATVEAELRKDPRFVRVVVQRRFPGTVSVRLTDRRAIAVVVGPTRGVVVGEGGVIIAVARGDEFLQHVEVTEDPPATPGKRLSAPIAAAVDVMGSMSFEIAVQIRKMSITAEGELVFDLGEGRTVLFGTVEDAERKLLATKTMLGPQIDPRGVCQLDVRVPTAPTMRRNPDCDPPPPTTVAPAIDPATGLPVVPATDPATDPAATDPAATATTVAPPADTAPPATTPPA